MSNEDWELALVTRNGEVSLRVFFESKDVMFAGDNCIMEVPRNLQKKYPALTAREIKDNFGGVPINSEACRLVNGVIVCLARKNAILCQIEFLETWIVAGEMACDGQQQYRMSGIAANYVFNGTEFVPVEE